ncbi:MAG: cell division topological specificity factor MinE, partial [Bacillota bacterium]
FDFRKIFGLDIGSKKAAKERLRLVLIHDRTTISQEKLENMKRDLIEVISRYIDIDVSDLEFRMEAQDEKVALVANIPITENNEVIKGA